MRTAELARRAEVNIETLRFYERRRLLPRPPRTTSGYREYDESAVRIVRFVKQAQELGFTLRDAGELLSLAGTPRGSCTSVKRIADAKIAEIDERIAALQSMRRSLAGLSASCDAGRKTCRLLETLGGDIVDGRASGRRNTSAAGRERPASARRVRTIRTAGNPERAP